MGVVKFDKSYGFFFLEKCTIRQTFAYNSRGFMKPLGHFGTPRESPDLYPQVKNLWL